jgi:putative ABC transport system permease protein
MIMSEIRFAARVLARSLGFTLLAALLLALGIGANTVIFGALDAILLRPLPVRNPERLVRFVQDIPRVGRRSMFPYSFYETLRDRSTTLAEVFGEAETQVAMAGSMAAEEVRVHLVTPEFFQVVNTPPLLGRTLSAADAAETPGTPPAVLSYGFWRRRFDGDRQVVGRTVQLHGQGFTVVGVLPRNFNGITIDTAPDIRVPMRAAPLLSQEPASARLENRAVDLGGRLKAGVSRERALAEARALWLATEGNDRDARREPLEADSLEHGISILRQRFSGALRLLIASVGLLQLMVCANLAGLLLARGARRSTEVAVRLALGATRVRLARQMLWESGLVTLLGAAGGVTLAYAAAPLLVRGLPPCGTWARRNWHWPSTSARTGGCCCSRWRCRG